MKGRTANSDKKKMLAGGVASSGKMSDMKGGSAFSKSTAKSPMIERAKSAVARPGGMAEVAMSRVKPDADAIRASRQAARGRVGRGGEAPKMPMKKGGKTKK